MSAIINFSVDLNKLKDLPSFEGKNGAKWINLSGYVNDESKFGNNVSIAVSQTQEDRLSKEPRKYLGNGKVVWTDGTIKTASLEETVDF
jgi:hypothetical protein